jgi:hypothetical protein
VKSFRFLLPAAVLALSACQALPLYSSAYTHFRVTNYRGDLIADWVAEGSYRRFGDAYEIKAVERTSGPPLSQTTRYPNGWRTVINGPHIIRTPTGKPYWLYRIDGQ